MSFPTRRRTHPSGSRGGVHVRVATCALALVAIVLSACAPATPPTHEPPARTIADLHIPPLVDLWTLAATDIPLDDTNILGLAVASAGGTPQTAVHAEVRATAPDGRFFLFDVVDAPGVAHDALAEALSRELAPRVVGTTRSVGPWGVTAFEGRSAAASTLWVATRGSRSMIVLTNGTAAPADIEHLLGAL